MARCRRPIRPCQVVTTLSDSPLEPRLRLRRRTVVGGAALVALVLVACGSDSADSKQLTIEGGETGQAMYFEPDAPEVEAGTYEVTFDNVGAVHHELAFLDESGAPLVARSIAGGTSATLEAQFDEGTYRMVCREPGHEAAGMVGTLVAR